MSLPERSQYAAIRSSEVVAVQLSLFDCFLKFDGLIRSFMDPVSLDFARLITIY